MLAFIIFLGCAPKHAQPTGRYLWPVGQELDYDVTVSQTGMFSPAGGIDIGATTFAKFTLSCVAEDKGRRVQLMNCTIPTNITYRISRRDGRIQDFPDQTYDGDIKLKWVGRQLKSFDADGLTDTFRASLQNAVGAMSTTVLPVPCEVGKQWSDKVLQNIDRLEFLNGPGSRKNEHKIESCGETVELFTTSTNRISAQVAVGADGTVSQEAPRFDFLGYSLSAFDADGLIKSREFKQELVATSLNISPGSVTQTVVLKRAPLIE